MLLFRKQDVVCDALKYLKEGNTKHREQIQKQIPFSHFQPRRLSLLGPILTLDMSLRPRSIRGRGFLSRMPASYGDTMAGLTKRRNMALPTAPMLFCGNR